MRKKTNHPIDLEHLQLISRHDPKELQFMVNVYLQETERDLMRMKKAILADDADLVYRLAHGCAGASLSYGMIAVLPVIREIEIKAKIGNLDDAMVHWAEAQRQFSRIQTFLKVIDDSNPQQKAA